MSKIRILYIHDKNCTELVKKKLDMMNIVLF